MKNNIKIDALRSDLAERVINICPKLSKEGFKVIRIPDDIYSEMYQKTIAAYYLENNIRKEYGADNAIPNENKLDPEVCFLNDNFFDLVHKNPDFIKLHEDFAGINLKPTYWYGPRVYLNGHVLKEHIDHPTTHLIGSSLKIFSEGDDEWPLTFLVDGQRVSVSLERGEMVIFEAVRVPHARPTPFKGKRYFGIFYHYAPLDFNAVASDEYAKLASEYEKIM
jgi:prolyl 4-hydroxylase